MGGGVAWLRVVGGILPEAVRMRWFACLAAEFFECGGRIPRCNLHGRADFRRPLCWVALISEGSFRRFACECGADRVGSVGRILRRKADRLPNRQPSPVPVHSFGMYLLGSERQNHREHSSSVGIGAIPHGCTDSRRHVWMTCGLVWRGVSSCRFEFRIVDQAYSSAAGTGSVLPGSAGCGVGVVQVCQEFS